MSAFVKNRSNQNYSFGLYRANEVSVAAFVTEGDELSGFIRQCIFKKDSRHAVCLIVKKYDRQRAECLSQFLRIWEVTGSVLYQMPAVLTGTLSDFLSQFRPTRK